MSEPRPAPSCRLTCSDVHFVEVDFPRTLRPRLVIQFSEALSLLLENRSAIPFAADFIVTVHQHLTVKNRLTKADRFPKNLKNLVHGATIPDEVLANPDGWNGIGEEHHDELDVFKAEIFWRRTILPCPPG